MIEPANSSFTTISTLINQMIGGAMLTFPIMYRDSGILTATFIVLISGIVSYTTCRTYVLHLSQSQIDVQSSIRRILGPKWQRFFILITGYYLILLNVIYIDLIVDQLYDVIYFILSSIGKAQHIADKDTKQLIFDKFSVQYLSLILFIPLLLLTFINKLDLLIRLSAYGVLSVAIYIIFIIYQFSTVISTIQPQNINLFKLNVGNLIGSAAIAFTIHTVVTPVMKANRNQSANNRDLLISYICGFILYSFIGILGSMDVQNIDCEITITNCYLGQGNWHSLIVQLSYLYGLCTVFPCFIAVCRQRLINAHYANSLKEPQKHSKRVRIFNILFVAIAVVVTFLSPYIPLDLIMNLVGSLMCYFFVYFIPFRLHLKCSLKLLQQKNSLITQNQAIHSIISQQDGNELAVCDHSQNITPLVIKIRYAIYSFINIIGVAIAIFGIYTFFKSILS